MSEKKIKNIPEEDENSDKYLEYQIEKARVAAAKEAAKLNLKTKAGIDLEPEDIVPGLINLGKNGNSEIDFFDYGERVDSVKELLGNRYEEFAGLIDKDGNKIPKPVTATLTNLSGEKPGPE